MQNKSHYNAAMDEKKIASEQIILNFDGGSRGNPGPAGIGAVLLAADGTPLVTIGKFIGRATNNVAEYMGLITALQEAKKLGAKKIIIRGDSELIIKQMRGEYRVKNPELKVLRDKAQSLLRDFPGSKLEHNLRGKNVLADTLANLAMDRKADVHDVDSVPSPLDEPSPISTKAGDRFNCNKCGCEIEVRQPSSIRPHQLKAFVCQCGNKMG
jgi:ribonuclease HI